MTDADSSLQPPDDEGSVVDQQDVDAKAGPASGGDTAAGVLARDDDAGDGGKGPALPA